MLGISDIIKANNTLLEIVNISYIFFTGPLYFLPINKSDSHAGRNLSDQNDNYTSVIITGSGGADADPIASYIVFGILLLFGFFLLIILLEGHVHTVWICGDCVATADRCCEDESIV